MNSIVFDMDGVILDTENLVRRVWNETAPEFGLSNIDEVFFKIVGTNLDYTEMMFRKTYGADVPYTEFRAASRQRTKRYIAENGIPLKSGVFEILDYLKAEHYKIALASSTALETVTDELRMAGVYDYFDVAVCGDMIKRSKPEPDIYLEACRRLNVKPAEAYAVEDSFNGVRSAHAAGLFTIMVPDILRPDAEIREKADVVIPSLAGVAEWLKEREI